MIIDKVNDILNSHANESSLMILCAFIKDNVERIPSLSMEQIAKETFMSKGQVSKCVKALDYANYEDFKDACYAYLDVKSKRKHFIDPSLNYEENAMLFTKQCNQNFVYALSHIDYRQLNELTNDLQKAHTIYLYARGDARSLCYNIQRELNLYEHNSYICDSDFKKEYEFKKDDILVFISTNGNTFHYDPRIITRLQKAKVREWLITCNKELSFSQNQLAIPSLNAKYNEYTIRHIIDILLLNIQNTK